MTLRTWRYADVYKWMEKVHAGFDPLIITCCVNGGLQGKEANPALPETPEEIATQVQEAYNAGASAVHIHARNPNNLADPTLDPDVWREVNAAVRSRCPDIIINNTTGGGVSTTMEERVRGLDAAPEMASLNMGPDMSRFKIPERKAPLPHPHAAQVYDECIAFTYGIIERLALRMKEMDVKPEMEVYQPGQYWATNELIQKGLVSAPYVHQFVMGYQTSIYPTPENIIAMIRELPADSVYFVAGVGVYQLPLTTFAVLMGGHVRVGLEDNIYYRRGQKLRGNGEVTERTVRIARELNREVASPAQARDILGLPSKPREFESKTTSVKA